MGWETWRPEGYKSTSTKWEDWQPTKPFGEAFDIKQSSSPNFDDKYSDMFQDAPVNKTKIEAPKLSLLDKAKDVGGNILDAGGKALKFVDHNISAPLATGYNDLVLNLYKLDKTTDPKVIESLEKQSATTRALYQSEDNSYLKNLGTGLLENAGSMLGGDIGGYAGLGQKLGNAVTPLLKSVGVGGKVLDKADEVARLLPMFGSSVGGATRNAEAQGLSEEDTKKYALINGLAEMGTEMLYMPDWFKKSVGMSLGDTLPTTLKASVKEYLKDAVAEGGEEVVSGLIQNQADKKYMGIDKTLQEQLADARDNFIGGSAFSGILGLPNINSYKGNSQYLNSINSEQEEAEDISVKPPTLNKDEATPQNDILSSFYDLIDKSRNPQNNFMLEAPKVNNENGLQVQPQMTEDFKAPENNENGLQAQPQMTQDFEAPQTPIANVVGLGDVKVVDVDTSSQTPNIIIEMASGEQYPIRNAIAQNSMTLIEQPNFSVDAENNINNPLLSSPDLAMLQGQAVDQNGTSNNIINNTEVEAPTPKILEQPKFKVDGVPNTDVEASNRVYSVDVNNINVDAETFQFKSNTDSMGTTNQFKNGESYDPYKAGVLTLYRDTDNKLYVVNGHHRLDFAKRSGVNRVDAQILNSKDGWSKAEARTLGAKINMAEGKGTATDSAKIFRENKLSIEDIKKDGISLSDNKIKTGYELSKLSEPLFRAVTTGRLSENKGAIIGRELEGSVTKQQEVFKLVKDFQKKGKNISDNVLNEIIQMAKASDTHKGQQETLFGIEEFEKSNMIQRGEVISGIKSRLSKEKNLFATLTNKNKADIIKAVGNKLADKTNADNLSEAELTMGILDTFKNAKGHNISDVISFATNKYSKGEITKAQAINEALNSIKNIIRKGEINGKINEGNINRSSKMPEHRSTTQAKNEYKQTTTQRDNIRKATTELKEVGRRYKISNTRGTDYYLNQGYTGLGIGVDFIKNHNLNIIGQEVKNYRDLVEVAQIYRDPRWETMRFVFTKNGVVVGETGITAHIPNASPVYKKSFDKEIEHLKKYMGNVQADSYYMLHNHPSGNPKASSSDVEVTSKFEEALGVSKGHIILNSNQFGLIQTTKNGDVNDTVLPLNYEGEGKGFTENLLKPSIPNTLLNKPINSQSNFAEVYKALQVSGDKITVVYTDAKLKIRGIQEVHINNLNNFSNFMGYLGNQMRSIGSTNNFIVAPSNLSKEHKSALRRMGENNITTDIMTVDNESWRANREFGSRSNIPNAIERQEAKNVTKRVNGVNDEKTEYIGDNFYSQMERIVDSRIGKKITPQELDKNINAWVKKGDIKKEEVKWSGIKEWLQDLDKETLTKEEVMKQIKDSKLVISKITTDDSIGGISKENQDRFTELKARREQIENEIDDIREDIEAICIKSDKSKQMQDFESLYDTYVSLGRDFMADGSLTRLDKYLENITPDMKLILNEYEKIMKISKEYDDTENEYQVLKDYIGFKKKDAKTTSYNKYITNGGTNYQEILFQIDSKNLMGQDDFSSSHFNHDNIIAHARTTDRVTVSTKDIPKREKVLYLEEVQSDLHQDGRRNGYVDSTIIRKLNNQKKKIVDNISKTTELITLDSTHKVYGRKVNSEEVLLDHANSGKFYSRKFYVKNGDTFTENQGLKNAIYDEMDSQDTFKDLDTMSLKNVFDSINGELYITTSNDIVRADYQIEKYGYALELATKSEIEKMREITYELSDLDNDSDDAVTDAPFSKNWEEFIIKNMIQKATEEGYERIAWTTGSEQAGRYNLSKFVDSLTYSTRGSEGDRYYSVTGYKNDGMLFSKYFYTKKDLSEFFGLEIAEQIINGEGKDGVGDKVISDLDIEVGGNGMKAFYDKILVDSVNKYVKKWKGKVEQVPINGVGERNSIKITDSMKKDVTENGQAVFERTEKYNVNAKNNVAPTSYGLDEVVLSGKDTNLSSEVARFGKNYREILFKGNAYGVNYRFRKNDSDTRGVLSFARTTDRNTLDGKKVLYLEEVASYEHQNNDPYNPINKKALSRAENIYSDALMKERPTEQDELNKKVYEKQIKRLTKTEFENYSPHKYNWIDISMSKVIERAINEGYDAVAWTNADERAKVLGLDTAKGVEDFYGKDMKNLLELMFASDNVVTSQNIKHLGKRDGIILSDEIKKSFKDSDLVREYTSNYNSEKERKHYETYSKSDAIEPELKKMIENTDKHYRQLGNQKVWNTAKNLVDTRYNYARELVSNKKTLETAYDVAISEAILMKLQTEKRWEEASEWADRISEKLTQAGQVVQAASMIGRMTPEGILRTANTMLKKTSTKKQREIQEKLIDKINKDFENVNGEALDDVIKKVLRFAKGKGINTDMSVPVNKDTGESFDFGDNDLDREDNIIKKALNKKDGPMGQARSKEGQDDKTSEKLASKVNSHIPTKKVRKEDPLNDMVNVLYGVAKQVLPSKNKTVPKSPMELINQAMVNREDYAICWNMAKEIVANKWAGNQEALDILNTYFAQYLDKPFSDNLMNKAINNAMETLDISLDELVRKHYSEVDFAQESLKEKFIYSGLSETEAGELSDFIEIEFKKMTEKKKNQILEKTLKSKPKTKKQKELWEKVVELSNLGAFEKNDFRTLVANKLGIGTITPELAKDLVDRANHLQTLEEGDEKNVEIQLMMDRIYAQVPVSKLTKASTIQAIAQLLNPLTFTRNFLGNIGFGVIDRYVTYIPAKMVDKLVSVKTGENTVFAPHPIEYRRGYKEGKKTATRDANLGINTRKVGTRFDTKSSVTYRPENMNKVEKFFKLDKLEKMMNKSLTGTDIAFKEGIIRESLYSQMKNAKVTEPTPEMIDIANQLADYRTFNNDTVLSSFFSNLKQSMNSPTYTNSRGTKGKKNEWGLGDMLIKYPKTPANIVSVAIDYSPAGLVSSIYKLWYSSKSTEVEFNQQAFSNGIGRGIVGSTLIAVGAVLAKLGVITGGGDDDKDLQALKNETGFGQYRINLSALDRLVGTGFDARYSKPQKDDLIVNYDWFQPLAIGIAIGANIEKRKDDDLGVVGSIVNGFNAGVDTLVEQPLVSGIKRFTQTRQITEAVTNMVQEIPASFVPTFVNQIKKLLDNQSRITYDNDWIDQMENKVKAKLPVLNQSLEPNIDTLGREKEVYQNSTNNPFNIFLNPSFTSRYNVDSTYEKALAIYEKTGAKEHLPVKLKSNISFEGTEYKLTPTEYTFYQKKVGQATVSIYKDAKTTGSKSELLDEAKRIANEISDAKSEARDEIIKKRGIQSVKPPTLNKYGVLSNY